MPSNITARIKKLEEGLGLSLFTRDRNRLQLTPSGQRLLHYAEQLLALRQQALDELSGDTPGGHLNIGSMESSAAARLPDMLVALHARYARLQVELATGASGIIAQRVLQGELDVAFVADPPDDARLDRVALFREELVVVKPPSLADSKGPASLPTPLTLVGFTEGCSYRHRLEAWLALGHRKADRIIEIPSYHTMLSCVLAGMGIAMVPDAVLRLHPAFRELAQEYPPDDIRHATTYLIWRADSETPAIRALVELSREFGNIGAT